MELWQGLTSGTRNRHIRYRSRGYLKRTVARIRYSRGGRKASATGVKVAGIGTSNVKAKELDSPLAWVAGVVGGSVPTAGAAAAEGVIGGREENAMKILDFLGSVFLLVVWRLLRDEMMLSYPLYVGCPRMHSCATFASRGPKKHKTFALINLSRDRLKTGQPRFPSSSVS
jgi:hypothetical protein